MRVLGQFQACALQTLPMVSAVVVATSQGQASIAAAAAVAPRDAAGVAVAWSHAPWLMLHAAADLHAGMLVVGAPN